MNRKDILEQAERCVNGGRQDDYGTPENNFACIAELWNIYLAQRAVKPHKIANPLCTNAVQENNIRAVDVAVMLALLKIARIATGHGTADSWIDLAGYAACGGEIQAANTGRGL